ncbi:MAG: response regulator [Lachnospiraceae bacterium]|nr:response regulator [Lachnospiraceae bacterium]
MKKSKIAKFNHIAYFVALGLVIILFVIIGTTSKLKIYDPAGYDREIKKIYPKYELVGSETAPAGVVERYTFKLPEIRKGNDCISFYTVHQNVNIYIDQILVYSLWAPEENLIGKTPASNIHFFDLGPQDTGKEMEIEVIPVYKQVIGCSVTFSIGDKKDIYARYLDNDMFSLILGLIPLLLGLIFLVMSIVALKEPEEKRSVFMLGVFAFELGTWKTLDLALAPLIFDNYPILISYISIIMLAFIAYPFLSFLKGLLNREYAVIDYAGLVFNISCFLLVLMQAFNIVDFRESLLISHVLLCASIFIVIYLLCNETVKGNTEPRLTVTVLGMALCALGFIYDLLQYYVVKHTSEVYTTLFCFDIYITVMGVVLAYDNHKMILEAKRRAEDANIAKSRFLSNMSHDIRTPMNAIVGFTGIAEKYMDDPERLKDSLQKIRSSGDHLLKLINDVLDMSKIESGKIALDVAPTAIKGVVDNVVNIMMSQMQDKGIEFITDIESIEHEFVYTDSLRVNQVLLNLLGNAYKFTPSGGYVKLTIVELPSGDPSMAQYEIRVKDNGIGMSEEFKNHAFEAFIREHDSQGDNIQGTGLGLAICKSIVELAGGTIRVDSILGAGTEFIINIGFYIANKEDMPEEIGNVENIDFGGKRVLLADDNQLNREIVIEILSSLDLVVDSAEDGDIAVEKVKSAPSGYYSAVLMDIQMPVMNGYDAARNIREIDDPAKSTIPIIAMTANAFEEDKLHAYEAGMNAHVAKPINIDELLRVLNTYIN